MAAVICTGVRGSTHSVTEAAADLARACKGAVQQELALPLDDQPETLSIVDHYLSQATPDDLALRVPMCGAYFGQVVCARWPTAHWILDNPLHLDSPDEAADPLAPYRRWRVEITDVNLRFNPIGVALEAAHRADAAGWGAHLQLEPAAQEAVQAALYAVGPVAKVDYYRLAVRFEVLDQAYATLYGRKAC